jgi:hypothetical protein
MCCKSFIFSVISILISSLLFFSGFTVSAQPAQRVPHIGPLFVEDLRLLPDPVQPGQQVRFCAKIRNDGNPIRANIRLQDKDQVVGELNDAFLNHGTFDYWFVQAPYQFQRFDHCFTVIVDVERTRYPVDATREFCAKPWGWTLRP